MSTFKKCQVVMLSTNQKAEIGTKNWYFKGAQALVINEFVSNLYILSDDEIKVGDWYIDDTDAIRQSLVSDPHYWSQRKYYKKIIATTNKSIKLPYDGKTSISENWGGYALPQLSEGFLDVYVDFYNRGESITEVMVEYIIGFGIENNEPTTLKKWLKVNPKDNTITIKKVKDSWSRDEVRHLMTQSYLKGIDRELDDFNKFIEENL